MMIVFFIFAAIIWAAIVFLRGFDKIAGRGPKQVKDGIEQSPLIQPEPQRIPCPHCSELILPTAKICRFCKSDI